MRIDDWVLLLGLIFFVVGVAGAVLPSAAALLRAVTRDRRDQLSSEDLADAAEKADRDTESPLSGLELRFYAQHHERALADSALKAKLGTTAASVGFLVILLSVGLVAFNVADAAWLGMISGVICEAVAALFFTQERFASKHAAQLFDRLSDGLDRQRAIEEVRALTAQLDGEAKQRLLGEAAALILQTTPGRGSPNGRSEPRSE